MQVLEEPREEGKACWLNDTALGKGFLKLLLAYFPYVRD